MRQIQVGKQTFLIPDGSSPCDLWRTYYGELVKEFGKSNARNIWLLTWDASPATFCATNPDFNKWLKKSGIDVSNAATRAVADLSAISGNILGFGKGMTKVIEVGGPILLGGVALVALILFINTAKKRDATDLAMLHPAGRAGKLAGLKMMKA